MKTKKVAKKGNYYVVTFDDDSQYKLHESVIIKYHLFRKNVEFDEEMLPVLLKETEEFVALDKALRYLAGLHTKNQVYQYIKMRFDSDVAKKTVRRLDEMNLLDDLEYAKNYTNYAKKKGHGPLRIKKDLEEEFIPLDDIDVALEDYSYEEELEGCEKLFTKYIPTLKKCSRAIAYEKIKFYLTSNGYHERVIRFTLEKNASLLDNIIDEDNLLQTLVVKAYKKYSKRYEGKALDEHVIASLARKGFSINKIKANMKGGK